MGEKADIVVGGGIAGIVTSMLLARSGREVVLIESEKEFGGLLRSHQGPRGCYFDYGTHVPIQTGIGDLDDLLFGKLEVSEDWRKFDRLRVGNYFGRCFNENSQFIDLRSLEATTQNRMVYEILSTLETEDLSDCTDSYTFATRKFGQTVTDEILEPLVQKFFGRKLAELEPFALSLLGCTRFVAFDREVSRQVKQSTFYDSKFAFSTWNDGIGGNTSFYPKRGGIDLWVKGMLDFLNEGNVRLLAGAKLLSVSSNEDRVTSVSTEEGQFEVDDLYWTINPGLLSKFSGVSAPIDTAPPHFRKASLVHLIFEEAFERDLYFAYCNDPGMISHRITLYPSLREDGGKKGPFNCTVEILGDVGEDEELVRTVCDELEEMGIVNSRNLMTYSKVESFGKGFPIPLVGLHDDCLKLSRFFESKYNNVSIFGRASGKGHFINEVITEIWNSFEAKEKVREGT